MEHLAFIHYAAMVHKYVQRSAYIPEHTSHQYSTAMIERFRELGGDVWFNCRATNFAAYVQTSAMWNATTPLQTSTPTSFMARWFPRN